MHILNWDTKGTGKINLVLLHGLGFNSKIWFDILKILSKTFTIYLVDLPGFGKNSYLPSMTINQIIKLLHYYMPKHAIWLGWSLGGLISSKFALSYPQNVLSIITVSSSPCFIEKKNWPGIKKNTFQIFKNNLIQNYDDTIINFLNIQMMNSSKTIFKLDQIKKKYYLNPNLI